MMELRIVGIEAWEAAAEGRIPSPARRFALKDPSGFKVAIEPGLSIHCDLTVLGGDWIPVRADGLAALDQMVHTPQLYLPKARNVRTQQGRCLAMPARWRQIDDDALLVGGQGNYYHWLIDHLPRLLYALKFADVRHRKLLVNARLTRFQRESLELMGVEPSRLIGVEDDEAVTVRSVLVPRLLSCSTVCHPLVRALVREEFTPTASGQKRRIYLCREDAASRRLTNERELADLVARWGFERHLLGDMSFQAQVDLFSGAEAVVAVHGAGLANLLFCPEGATVFEIFTPQHHVTSMMVLAHIGRQLHVGVPATVAQQGTDGNPLLGWWTADLEAMEHALRQRFGGQ